MLSTRLIFETWLLLKRRLRPPACNRNMVCVWGPASIWDPACIRSYGDSVLSWGDHR